MKQIETARMRRASEELNLLAIVRDLKQASAIEVTRELIWRGQCANYFAIGEVDRIRPILKGMVRKGGSGMNLG